MTGLLAHHNHHYHNCTGEKNRAWVGVSSATSGVNMSTFLRKVRGSYLFCGYSGYSGYNLLHSGVAHAWPKCSHFGTKGVPGAATAATLYGKPEKSGYKAATLSEANSGTFSRKRLQSGYRNSSLDQGFSAICSRCSRFFHIRALDFLRERGWV